ncbi:UNVERIFIED_ORG: hypothetical protein M2355_001946 [Lelliottia amnigena]|nr:hypothetical protein [Lelliottia amnigena]
MQKSENRFQRDAEKTGVNELRLYIISLMWMVDLCGYMIGAHNVYYVKSC